NDLDLTAFHDGHDRVRRAQVDADDFFLCHVCAPFCTTPRAGVNRAPSDRVGCSICTARSPSPGRSQNGECASRALWGLQGCEKATVMPHAPDSTSWRQVNI